jgi:glycosyltransferase involved in cell wall biosynthesis
VIRNYRNLNMFSIIIPLYNKENYVRRTIDSVLVQEHEYYEVIVVDDGSTDGGAAIVASYAAKDSRIRLIKQANGGVSFARNRGMAEASGGYYVFLDADDTWEPEHLSEIVALSESYPEAALLGTAYQRCFSSGPSMSLVLAHLEGKRSLVDDYFKYVVEAQFIYTSSIAVAAWAIDQVGGFPEGVRNGEDLDLWFRLAIRWPVAYSGKPTVKYNCDVPGQATGSGAVVRGLSTGFISGVIALVNAGKDVCCAKICDVYNYQQHKITKLLGIYLMDRAFTASLYSDFIKESGIGGARLNQRNRLLIRLPYPLLWRPYYFLQGFLSSRKYIGLHYGKLERRGVLYSFYDEP